VNRGSSQLTSERAQLQHALDKKVKLTILAALMALASLANAQYVTNKAFFSGAHLGMTIDECVAHYGSIPMSHSDPREGEKFVEFRHISQGNPNEQWRVLIYFRESDRKIVYLSYWKLGPDDTFSPEEIRYLTDLNSGQGPLVTHVDNDGEFEVTTVEHEKLEFPNGR
jgi:hypothetical protein